MVEDDRKELDLDVGDFLYQVDQELFLVVIDEREDSYLFSAHGWRDISKKRAHEYVNGAPGKLHDQETFESVVEEEGDDETRETYEQLKELFDEYADDFESGEIGDTFAMEDN